MILIDHGCNFSTPNELKHVHLLVIELEHPIFGFEQTDIEPNRPSLDLLNYSSNRLKHHFLSIELTRTCSSFICQISNTLFLARTLTFRSLFLELFVLESKSISSFYLLKFSQYFFLILACDLPCLSHVIGIKTIHPGTRWFRL